MVAGTMPKLGKSPTTYRHNIFGCLRPYCIIWGSQRRAAYPSETRKAPQVVHCLSMCAYIAGKRAQHDSGYRRVCRRGGGGCVRLSLGPPLGASTAAQACSLQTMERRQLMLTVSQLLMRYRLNSNARSLRARVSCSGQI